MKERPESGEDKRECEEYLKRDLGALRTESISGPPRRQHDSFEDSSSEVVDKQR